MATIRATVGEKFGLLRVVGDGENVTTPSGRRRAVWLCVCKCGVRISIRACNLKSGNSTSCGCILRSKLRTMNRTHGGTSDHKAEYHTFQSAKARCQRKSHPRYKDWGGRGIKFKFKSFEQWFSEIGPKPSPRYIHDRINNNRHYEPGNVKWSTPKQSSLNRRPRRWWKRPS